MVKITNFFEVERKDGTKFISLELTGNVVLLQSQSTGAFYATVRKCRIPSTFDAAIAKEMIGQKIEGEIVQVLVEPYEYLNKKTGEIMTLQHSFAYRPKGSVELMGETPLLELETA
ncbi:MAG: hypothetical protein KGL19_16370 [Bacteroidota bacterium]|nr:hypothetical protein [Bacteroidota bacterium]